jgi:twitching motility protein PilT
MTKLTPDPQLEQLVRELNTPSPGEQPATRSQWPPETIAAGDPLEKLLSEMIRREASDLHLIAGAPPVFRVGSRLLREDAEVLEAEAVQSLLAPLITARMREQIERDGAADFSLRLNRTRFRINVHRQRGTLAAAIRALPMSVPTLAELDLPQSLAELVKPRQGLVLICGPTGAGKSTTLAALIDEINRTDSRHVITIEDPLEYEHRNRNSVIEQIEIGRDAPSFAAALRAALRQDPDVILVGEMRDRETVATAITAAETGHLILSTVHTGDAAQAIHRIIDVFPPEQQRQIKLQIAITLNAIICQQLIPRTKSDRSVVAVEVLIANAAVRNHIRNDKLPQLGSEITLGRRQGMISLEDSLARLVQGGLISAEDARARSARPDELDSLLRK